MASSILQEAGLHSSMLTTCLDTAGVLHWSSGAWIRQGSLSAPDVNLSRRMVVGAAITSGSVKVKFTRGQRPGPGRLKTGWGRLLEDRRGSDLREITVNIRHTGSRLSVTEPRSAWPSMARNNWRP